MFFRIFVYKLKELSRKFWLVGWNFIFPLVLATAFYLGFGNLVKDDPEYFHTIEVGYVNETIDRSESEKIEDASGDEEDNAFYQVLEELAKENVNNNPLLAIHIYETSKNAELDMNQGNIAGFYLEKDDEVETIVPANGMTATTMNEIIREYNNQKSLIQKVAKEHPEKIEKAIQIVSNPKTYLKQYDFGNDTSQYMQYFFALLAMTSLFSSWISTSMLEGICANMSERGKRFECAPVNKLSSITAGILAGLFLQAMSNIVVIMYIEYVLGIHFGIPMGAMFLISTLGSAMGISFGVFIGAICKRKELLISIPLAFTMLCSMLSGLMWGQMKQMIQSHCPMINKINPAAVLTDCLYVRATYGKTDAYYFDIISMGVITFVLLLLSSILLRRRKYVSF